MSASSLASEAAPRPNRWTRIAERGSLWGLRFTAWLFRAVGRGPTLVLVTADRRLLLPDGSRGAPGLRGLPAAGVRDAGRTRGPRARATHVGRLSPLPGLRPLDRRPDRDLVRKDGRLPARDPRVRAVRPAGRAEARGDRAGRAPRELRRDADAGGAASDGGQRPDVHGATPSASTSSFASSRPRSRRT